MTTKNTNTDRASKLSEDDQQAIKECAGAILDRIHEFGSLEINSNRTALHVFSSITTVISMVISSLLYVLATTKKIKFSQQELVEFMEVMSSSVLEMLKEIEEENE